MKNLLERLSVAGYVVILIFFFVWMLYSQCSDFMNGEFLRSIHRINHGGPCHMDFVRSYAMAKLASSPERFQIYDPAVQLLWMNKVIAPAVMQHVFYMEHPPYVFLLIMPLALFSISHAYVLWAVFSSILAAIAVWLLLRNECKKKASFVIGLLFGLNASFVAWWSHLIGQFGLVLLAIICLFWWAVLRRCDGIAGLALALSTIKPQHLPFLLLPVLAERRWRVLKAFMLSELVLLGVSSLWFGWRNVVFYPLILYRSEVHPWSEFDFLPATVCLRGALAVYLPKAAVAGISIGVCAIILVLLFVLWRRAFVNKLSLFWPISLTMSASCAFGPHTFLYDCAILIISSGLTLSTLNPTALLKLKPLSLKVWSSLLLFYPLFSWVLSLWMVAPGDELSRYRRTVFAVALNIVIFTAGIIYYGQMRKVVAEEDTGSR